MTLDADCIETITFDSFTTLVDVAGPTRRALAAHVDDPEPIATLWRHRAVEYRMVSTYVGCYETYEETTRDALEYALAAHGEDLSAGAIDGIAATFRDLDVFDDVRGSFAALSEAGYDLYVLSNGNPDLLSRIVASADIGDLIEGCISAHEIRAYKPAERFYRHAATRTDTRLEEIAHVTAPWYDVYGAKHAGMGAVWVNRDGGPWEAFDGEPDLVVESLRELPDRLS